MSESPLEFLYHDLEYLGSAAQYVDEILEVTRHTMVFEQFFPTEIELLCRFMHCYAAPADKILLQEGTEGDHLLLILTGRVAVRKYDVFGRLSSIATVGPGDILGEMSLVDGEHRFATCVTTEPVRFATMTRMDFTEITALQPRLANKFLFMLLHIMVGRLRDTGMRAISSENRQAGP